MLYSGIKTYISADKSELPPLMAIDSSNNVYLTFSFGEVLQLGNGQNLISNGGFDVVTLKIDPTGTIAWANQQGNEFDDAAQTISVTPTGDRVLVGHQFRGSQKFDTRVIESFVGKTDMVVRALNATGDQQWVFRIGSSDADRKLISTCAATGKFYLSGAISGLTTFDTQQILVNGESNPDFYICRVSKDGAIEFVRPYGGTSTEVANDIYVDAKGATYIAGYFTQIGEFSNGEYLEAMAGDDGFLARYRADGSFDWVYHFAGAYADQVSGIVLGPDNSPYVTGTFDTRLTIGDTTIQGQRSDDVFVAGFLCGPNTQITPRLDSITICQSQDSLVSVRNGYVSYLWKNGQTTIPTETRSFINTNTLPVGTSVLRVTITDEYGCTGISKPITVTVKEPAPLPTIVLDQATGVLTCDISDVTYLWYREGLPIPNATAKTYVTTGQQGLFKVLITDSKGCQRFSNAIQIGNTSITEFDEPVGVYPNPFSGTLTVKGWQGASVTVLSTLGQPVLKFVTTTDSYEVSTEQLAAGAYTILVQLPGRTVTFSTVKQ